MFQSYALRKKPASEMHLTLVVVGKRDRNLSQFKMEANPPAEQPERIACHYKLNLIVDIVDYIDYRD